MEEVWIVAYAIAANQSSIKETAHKSGYKDRSCNALMREIIKASKDDRIKPSDIQTHNSKSLEVVALLYKISANSRIEALEKTELSPAIKKVVEDFRAGLVHVEATNVSKTQKLTEADKAKEKETEEWIVVHSFCVEHLREALTSGILESLASVLLTNNEQPYDISSEESSNSRAKAGSIKVYYKINARNKVEALSKSRMSDLLKSFMSKHATYG